MKTLFFDIETNALEDFTNLRTYKRYTACLCTIQWSPKMITFAEIVYTVD